MSLVIVQFSTHDPHARLTHIYLLHLAHVEYLQVAQDKSKVGGPGIEKGNFLFL